jgi:hypothetical protein
VLIGFLTGVGFPDGIAVVNEILKLEVHGTNPVKQLLQGRATLRGSFMNLSLIPTSVRAPLVAAPTKPNTRQREIRSISLLPEAAAERPGGSQANGSVQFNLALLVLDATTASSRSSRYRFAVSAA